LLHRASATFDRLGRQTSTTQNVVDGTTTDSTTAGTGLDDDVRSTFAYDALGELIAYCPARNLAADGCNVLNTTTTSLPYRSAWHYTFDKLGRQTKEAPPVIDTTNGSTDLAVHETVYDAGGLVTAVRDIWDGVGSTPSGVCGTQNNAYRYTSVPVASYDFLGRPLDATTTKCGTPAETLEQITTYGTFGRTSVDLKKNGASVDSGNVANWTYDSNTGLLDQQKRGNAVVTDVDWNADGTLAKRVDADSAGAGISGYTFSYDWAKRQIGQSTATGQTDLLGGTLRQAYRLDGLLASRTWPGATNTPALTYDTAKRPSSLTVGSLATFTQTYDRAGNTASESRSIPGVSGANGGQLQGFSYDGLNRLIRATLNTTTVTDYEYDLDGNRRVAGSVTSVFNRADQITSNTNGSFAYDRFGNLLTNRESATATTYTYDIGDHLATIVAGGTTTTIGLDTLGRPRSRAVSGGSTTTYSYLGDTRTVSRLDDGTGGNPDVSAVLGADGSRLVARQTSPTGVSGELVPDLHGNVVATVNTSGTTVTGALRYDAFGVLVGSPYAAGGPDLPWRFQGRLDLAKGGTNAPALYDFGARTYSPGLGTFTSLDTVAGSAVDPRSMNRYLYALANPWTLVDPDGHNSCSGPDGGSCGLPGEGEYGAPNTGSANYNNPTPPSSSSSSGSNTTSNNSRADSGAAPPPKSTPRLPSPDILNLTPNSYDWVRMIQDVTYRCQKLGEQGACDLLRNDQLGIGRPQCGGVVTCMAEVWGVVFAGAATGEVAGGIGGATLGELGTIGTEITTTARLAPQGIGSACLATGLCQRIQSGLQGLVSGLEGTSAPNPTGVLQTEVDNIVTGFSKQSGAFESYLSKAETSALHADPIRRGPAAFGNAVERALRERIDQSETLSSQFAYSAKAGRWDFTGKGPYSGMPFELTTNAAVGAHADRPYGLAVEYITYDRPDEYLFYLYP
jgi:RHS repeat-associated protein